MTHTVAYVLSIFVVLGLSGNRLMYSASAQIVALPPGSDVLASTYAGDWISNLYHGSVFVGDLDRRRTNRGRIDRMDLIMSGLQAPLFVDPDSNAVPTVPDPLPFTATYLHRTTAGDDSLEYVRDVSPLPEVFFSDASYNDYDNDGDLDVLLAGATRDGPSRGLHLTLPAGTYFWSVQALDASYAGSAFADEGSFTITSGKNDALTSHETEGVPASFALDPAYPNPFREQTVIRFSLPETTDVRLDVYDVRGHRVRQLTAGAMPAGNHMAVWDGRNAARVRVASGVYVYRLVTADGPTLTRTATLIR